MALSPGVAPQAGECTRRRLLIGALGSAAALAQASRLLAANDFWNTKDPSTWNDEEIDILTSKSPWARSATPSFKESQDPTDPTAGRSGGGRGMGRPAVPPYVIVRWESARPILDAFKANGGEDFDTHYVLSVSNLILGARRPPGRAGDTEHEEALDRMQNGALLLVKGKDTAEAGFRSEERRVGKECLE